MLTVSKVQPDFFPVSDNLFQTYFWGQLKEAFGQKALYLRVEFENDEGLTVAYPFLVLLRKINGKYIYAYVQSAPSESVIVSDKTGFLEELSLALKDHLPDSIIFIRYDLQWINPEPHARTEMLEIMMNYGTQLHNFKKAPSDHFCKSTCILNLRPIPEMLLKNMRQQTRNSVRRAYRESVEFSIYDAESPDIFLRLREMYDIYKDTAGRKGFYCEGYSYFEKLFSLNREFLKEKEVRNYDSGIVPLDAQVPPPRFYLFTAQKEGVLLSGLILGICGANAYYMYAASSMDMRHCMPNYGLQWEVIRFARSKGCTRYDFMGIPPVNDSASSMSGLYIFKTGFGGNVTHYMGTWDFPLKQEEYEAFKVNESLLLK
ncbi:peptidoglycan bridge formation glycyltransferase FemA/FemB family protein [Treponema sp.]|uniref:lipid II:glycine glycyltransferase FemX n=1 Tax=Treponema sp. TaxID=166 RepID=UPI0025D7B5FE|nr:peptidoglycan bridge formation glycyltransferase FemA/FemB family protein [Treponema sp.]